MTVLLTPEELAKRWRMDPKTLSNWRVKGRGPEYLKLGAGRNNKVLYPEDKVLAYERQHIKERK
jgi:hypothetical protein